MGSALLARLVFPALTPQEKGPFWADVTKTGSGEGQKPNAPIKVNPVGGGGEWGQGVGI